ncbi:OmpA family protein [Pararhodospirillum photometricum]|nr:OmpA family protein [Pararhodospirillum photometricum]
MLRKVAVSVVAVGLLTACAETWDYAGVAKLAPAGGPFDAELQKGYVALAEYEQGGGDWSSVAYYTGKARAAALGRTPEPTRLAERDLKAYHAELEKARAELIAVLAEGAKQAPALAAKAQVSFDCWAEEAEEGRQPERINECKQNFQIALGALPKTSAPLAAAPAGEAPGLTLVHFDKGGVVLSEESERLLDSVAQAFRKERPARLLIVGHTDTTGSAEANILLSQRRAEAVARSLVRRGIAAEVMTLEAYGEERLAVNTPRGVAEAQNRRVEISFEK